MAFPSAWLDELLHKNDIVSVVSDYVELKPKGRKLWACCPLHGEKTPSFSVSPDKQLFYCFGCHAGGTVIQFLMDMERLTFYEAVQQLANRVNMELPNEINDREMQRQRAYKKRIIEANKEAARYYSSCFLNPAIGKDAQAYAMRRGLTSEIVTRFGIGYAPDTWDSLLKLLKSKGYSEKELVDAGLLVHNTERNTVYDAFRGRLIFPILGVNGDVLGFGARVMGDEKPKYINTGDTPVYNKRNNLYGLYLHKNEKLDDLIMVEGYMDVIGLYKAGVKNAVASLGTALTQQQARLLKRYVEKVYIAYDGDAAGQNAMVRGLDILKTEGLEVRVITFPDDLDPDEYVQIYGKDGFDRLKENALSLNAFKLEAMAKGYDLNDENGRERYAKAACAFVAGLQPIEQERYYKQIAKKTGYALEALEAQGVRSGGIQTGESKPMIRGGFRRRVETGEDPRDIIERTLIAACLHDKRALGHAMEAHAEELFRNTVYETMFRAMSEQGSAFLPAKYIGGLEGKDAETASAVLREDEAIENAVESAADCIRRMKRENEEEEIAKLQAILKKPDLTAEERNAVLKEITERIRANK
ncbi:MAG: DNA primase [Clostridia bacterium]|nr:DNA primase [Clostridia bacterium]